MRITDVKIRKLFEDGPMCAVASITFDEAFVVHDVKVIFANERYFIVMPSRKNADGTFRDVAHPINAGFRAELEAKVLEAYEAERERAAKAAAEAPAEGPAED